MLQNWDKWINKKFPKVSLFKGSIPQMVVTLWLFVMGEFV